MYQIPVVSVNDLSYGTYNVTIEVYEKIDTYTGAMISLNRGGEFYFDALRVYDPIDISGKNLTGDAAVAQSAYEADGEKDADIFEVRQNYLSEKQGIAFKLTSTATPASIDIGAKSADGEAVILNASLYSMNDENSTFISEDITSCCLVHN